MDFRKELAKELGLGAIAEDTMLYDYVKACEAIAIRYHESEVKKLNIPVVSLSACEHPTDKRVDYHDGTVLCTECYCIISQYGKEINPPHKL